MLLTLLGIAALMLFAGVVGHAGGKDAGRKEEQERILGIIERHADAKLGYDSWWSLIRKL